MKTSMLASVNNRCPFPQNRNGFCQFDRSSLNDLIYQENGLEFEAITHLFPILFYSLILLFFRKKMRSRHVKIWSLVLILSICFNQFVIGKRSGNYGRYGLNSHFSPMFAQRRFNIKGRKALFWIRPKPVLNLSDPFLNLFSSPTSHNYGGGTGRGRWTDRLFGRGRSSGTSTGRSGILGGTGGGILGHGSRHNYGANRGTKTGGVLGGLGASRGLGGGGHKNSMLELYLSAKSLFRTLRFRSSGMGSRSRANTFKNMLVGAAGGFLAYKAGKALIKNVAAPMMQAEPILMENSQFQVE